MLSCPHIIVSEYNQTYHTSHSCYFVLDLLCVGGHFILQIGALYNLRKRLKKLIQGLDLFAVTL